MKLKICFLGFLCLNLSAKSQDIKQIKPLTVGDHLPDLSFNMVINYGKPELKIADFKGKNIILDFWETWCGSCLAHFNSNDSLQREFGKDLQIILVDAADKSETKEKIEATFARFGTKEKPFCVPSVYRDTLLGSLFPHHYIPHYVWIDKFQTIRAITDGEDVSRESVRTFINSGHAPIYLKTDVDKNRPVFTSSVLPFDRLEQYSIFLKGKIEGVGNGGGRREINDTPRGIIFHNHDLMNIYESLMYVKFSGVTDMEKRFEFNVRDTSKLFFKPGKQTKLEWRRQNLYTYELVLPASEMSHLFEYAITDLNRYTPFNAELIPVKKPCLILLRTNGTDRLKSKGRPQEDELNNFKPAAGKKKHLTNSGILALCTYIDSLFPTAHVIDETGYKDFVDISFDGPATDLAMLRSELQKYGLQIKEEERNIDILKITDKP